MKLATLHSNMDRLKQEHFLFETVEIIPLHSNMDRLKLLKRNSKDTAKIPLHSNMDRLKPNQITYPVTSNCLYIPIWID